MGMGRKLSCLTAAFVLITGGVHRAVAGGTTLTSIRVASGLSQPIFVTSPPGDFNRLFIVQQGGMIRILTGGSVLPTPYLNISALITTGGERGLLGMAFHPNYSSNGFFYVNYTNLSGNTVIARYTVSGDPNVANAGSAVILKTITQPESNHNGGCLQFGPDGMLYVGMGDGGGGNDQHGAIGNGQALNTLLGKMLRLDVANPPTYVPADNPFVGPGDPLDEIWAIGVRNPWRFSFDRLNGDMYMADVGQNAWEEVNFQPGTSNGGENYGWRCMEGMACTGLTGCTCNSPSLTLPIHVYSHAQGCSVTGGYVYRGTAIPGLQGTYFFGDYCSATIWSFRYNGTITEFTDRTAELVPDVGTINSITSFGEDAAGELYICDHGGEIFKIVADMIDCNNNGIPDDQDIAGGTSRDCNANAIPDECDLDGGGSNDCNGNTFPDECDTAAGTSPDCNNNDVPDECETDCNNNGRPDSCDVAGGTSPDCQPDGTPDECQLAGNDCNADGTPDNCQLAGNDCDANEVPDDCDPDCNNNGIADACDIAGPSDDCDANGVPDECQEDCDNNGTADACDVGVVRFEDNFETDQGWTVESTAPVDGVWQRGDPIQTAFNAQVVQPETDNPAGTGTLCFVTEASGPVTSSSDVDNGPTRLISPVMDLTAGVATVRYAYWFHTQLGVPDSMLFQVSNDGGTSWVTMTTHSVSASVWREFSGQVDSVITRTANMRFRFVVGDPGNDSYTEGLVDDFVVTTPDCPTGCTPPSAAVSGVCSNRIHTSGPCCIPISGVIPAESSEPRQGGIQEVRVTFDQDLCPEAFTLNAAAVTIEETSTALYPLFQPYAGPSVVTTSGSGPTLVLGFAPALADARAYRVTFTPAVTALAGQGFDIRALTADVNGSGTTDALDRSSVVGIWTGNTFTCQTDLNRDGGVNSTDRSIVVAIWTSGNNRAP